MEDETPLVKIPSYIMYRKNIMDQHFPPKRVVGGKIRDKPFLKRLKNSKLIMRYNYCIMVLHGCQVKSTKCDHFDHKETVSRNIK